MSRLHLLHAAIASLPFPNVLPWYLHACGKRPASGLLAEASATLPKCAPTPCVQVVVGCAKPRFFSERSNLFEVHTRVRPRAPAGASGVGIIAYFAITKPKTWPPDPLAHPNDMPAATACCAEANTCCRPVACVPCRGMPCCCALLARVPKTLVIVCTPPLPALLQTGMLWNTEGGSPMIPIGEEDLPTPILASCWQCMAAHGCAWVHLWFGRLVRFLCESHALGGASPAVGPPSPPSLASDLRGVSSRHQACSMRPALTAPLTVALRCLPASSRSQGSTAPADVQHVPGEGARVFQGGYYLDVSCCHRAGPPCMQLYRCAFSAAVVHARAVALWVRGKQPGACCGGQQLAASLLLPLKTCAANAICCVTPVCCSCTRCWGCPQDRRCCTLETTSLQVGTGHTTARRVCTCLG